MNESLSDYEARISAEVLAECEAVDLLQQRFSYIIFVSRSKGKGRTRSRITEVELISDTHEAARRFYTWDRFPFDTKATEVYGNSLDGMESESRLMRDIPKQAKRG